MRAIISVVCGLRMINYPWRIVSCVVEHNIHNAQETRASKSIKCAFQLSPPLLPRDCCRGFEEVVIDCGLSSYGIVTERLTVLLEWSEVDRVIAKLAGILKHILPP